MGATAALEATAALVDTAAMGCTVATAALEVMAATLVLVDTAATGCTVATADTTAGMATTEVITVTTVVPSQPAFSAASPSELSQPRLTPMAMVTVMLRPTGMVTLTRTLITTGSMTTSKLDSYEAFPQGGR
ncbi:hypothetical protein ADL19_32725 [Streptomyces purpurogeneiscleroticus]|nr:hypothetical protein ADL19_32725 [Streptomyces purpurogeneiscleroticus]